MRDGNPYNLLNIVLIKSALRQCSVTNPEKKPVLDFLVWGFEPYEFCLESSIPRLDIDFLEPLTGRINRLFFAKACSRLTVHDRNSVSNIDAAMSLLVAGHEVGTGRPQNVGAVDEQRFD